MKHILYISYDGMTDPLGQSQVLPYLRELVNEGFHISLISCEKPDKFSEHRQTIEHLCSEAGIAWYPLRYTKKPPLLSTLLDIRKINQKAKDIYSNQPFQLVHCRSYIAALVGLKLKKSHQVKFLFDMRGFWADERVDGGIWSLSNPVYKKTFSYFKKKERQFLSQADHIISLTEKGKNVIVDWQLPAVESSKITVIPCCVDLELFNPTIIQKEEQVQLLEELNLKKEHYVIGYVGSIGTWYMLPEMLDYFKVLKEVNSAAKFLFVSGENPATILELAQRKGIAETDIRIVKALHHRVPHYISLFNEAIFFIRPTFSKQASSPTKQGELMAMGIPLICNAGVGDTDYIVNKYQAGTVLYELTLDSFTKLIREGVDFNQQLTMQGAQEFFSLNKGIHHYATVYRSLL